MKRWARTSLLAAALLGVLLLLALMAAHRSRVVHRGQATVEKLMRTINELESDATKTKQEVREILRAICDSYPELKDQEICQ